MRRILGRSFAAAGLAWLAWRLFGPDPVPRTMGEQRRPLMVPGRSVFVGRHEFFVRELGDADAPVLVLIHGWNFDGEMAFHKLAPRLAQRYRVIVPDLRNHGKSDRIRGRFELSDVAEEVKAILDQLGIAEPVAVLGYSMGGMVAQEFALSHPGAVSKLVLGATAARPLATLRPLSWLGFAFTRAVARISRAEAVWASFLVLKRNGLIGIEDEAWMWDSLLARDANLYHEAAFAMWRFDARSRIGSLAMPVLVVIPERDALVRVPRQEELAALIPHAEVVRLPELGHESVLAEPELFASAVEHFLEDDPPGVSGVGEA
ncbi:MAG: alpha/beta hydrolase, partial [Acidimicrobiia bacterium]|nr:alpha/beta hydrolase [Acidimicrobiia bacterium]